jgi:hypothetical protein
MIATSGSHTPFVFSPAEVQYLFTGPFTRRQLLTYKILTQFLLTLPFTVFMAIGVRSLSGTFFSGFVATVLTFVFMQLFGLCVSLVSCSVGELIFSRLRKAVLWGTLIALIAAAVLLFLVGFAAGCFTTLNGAVLLRTTDPHARLCELHAERDPLYREVADITMETGSQSLKTLVAKLEQRLARAQHPASLPPRDDA